MHSSMWLKSGTLALALSSALSLSACGTDPNDRMLSGGLLGAGAGAAIGSVTGSVGKGALIGGIAGAALGGLTKPRDVYLGEPPWRHSSRTAYYHRHHYSRVANSGCETHYTDTKRVTTCPRR